MSPLEFRLNGRHVTIDAAPDRRLADILRDHFQLMGTKIACGIGRCGACAVLLDGSAVNACLVMAYRLPGAEVVTAEGLAALPTARAVRQALTAESAFQCGYCAPGFTVALTALFLREANPDISVIEETLGGNLCRCSGYNSIRRAAAAVAKLRAAHPAAN